MNNIFKNIEENKILTAIRNGMIMAIPIMITGSIALLLMSIPLDGYQEAISEIFGGFFFYVFKLIYNVTLNIISLILILTISYSYEKLNDYKYNGMLPLVNLCCYIAFSVDFKSGFSIGIFEANWFFNAIVITIMSSVIFIWINTHIHINLRLYSNGADTAFNKTMSTIIPVMIVIFLFAVLNGISRIVFKGNNIQIFISDILFNIFNKLGRSLLSGLLFIFLMHFMWFFGMHGSNVLYDIGQRIFESGIDINYSMMQTGKIPTEIMTKTFLDTFVLFGGCGTILCFIIAVFICEKRKSIIYLSQISLVPVLFNINEIIIFGLPVVFNWILFIPFLLTPLVLTIISYEAMKIGFIPCITERVQWTTPIFLSGYIVSGSIKGSILQLFNLIIGILIYIPFIKISQKNYFTSFKESIKKLVDIIQECEQRGVKPKLLDRKDKLGMIAKSLVDDIKNDIKHNSIELFYQPQVDYDGKIWGAEALLRWKHNIAGYIYPPLIIAIAEEAGFLNELGYFIIEDGCKKISEISNKLNRKIEISVNVTAEQLDDDKIVIKIKEILDKYNIDYNMLGIEITEQSALSSSELGLERLKQIKDMGIHVIMDDFGMGHSSMMYLQNNRFDMVKLDGSLIRELMQNDRCADIIDSIIYLSSLLNFKIIAEYVETEEQKEKLKELGCTNYQGYLFSQPITYEKLKEFINRN